jgi:hypothetical protein
VVVVELEALGLRSYGLLLSDHDLYMRIPIHYCSSDTTDCLGEQASGVDPEIRSKASHHQIIADAETFATCQ